MREERIRVLKDLLRRREESIHIRGIQLQRHQRRKYVKKFHWRETITALEQRLWFGYGLRLVEGSRSVARVSIELGQQKYKEGNIKKENFGILKKMAARLSSELKYHIG